MKKLIAFLGLAFAYLALPKSVHAAVITNPLVNDFVANSLKGITTIAGIACSFFLVKGGYQYMSSRGSPEALESAKKTIRNALIGLVLVLAANTVSSFFYHTWTASAPLPEPTPISIRAADFKNPSSPWSLEQMIMDMILGFIKNIVLNTLQPLIDGTIYFLTSTPLPSTNEVIFNLWKTMVLITDALFALVIGLIGLQFMSASTFGFEEIELKKILPRLGLAFLGANTSIFIIDWIIRLVNTLVQAILQSQGGVFGSFVDNVFNVQNCPSKFESISSDFSGLVTKFLHGDIIGAVGNQLELTKDTLSIFNKSPQIKLLCTIENAGTSVQIFMLIFMIVAVILTLFYFTRLAIIAIGAVLSPLMFLLWAIPNYTDFAEISAKSYISNIFTTVVHAVIILLSTSLIFQPQQTVRNGILSLLAGIAVLSILIKSSSMMNQLISYNSGRSMVKKLGGEIKNLLSTNDSKVSTNTTRKVAAKKVRKVVAK